MGRCRGFLLASLAIPVLAGCAPVATPGLDDLRARFTAAGGSCSEWTLVDDPRALSSARCDGGATLVVFSSSADRADFIKAEIETNEKIRARTHIIVSKDTWLVIGTLAEVVGVWPELGGMISGRNGANP